MTLEQIRNFLLTNMKLQKVPAYCHKVWSFRPMWTAIIEVRVIKMPSTECSAESFSIGKRLPPVWDGHPMTSIRWIVSTPLKVRSSWNSTSARCIMSTPKWIPPSTYSRKVTYKTKITAPVISWRLAVNLHAWEHKTHMSKNQTIYLDHTFQISASGIILTRCVSA